MRFVDEFRDPEMARVLAREIACLADPRRHTSSWKCGGHTHTIYKHGIEDYPPPKPHAGARPGGVQSASSPWGGSMTPSIWPRSPR